MNLFEYIRYKGTDFKDIKQIESLPPNFVLNMCIHLFGYTAPSHFTNAYNITVHYAHYPTNTISLFNALLLQYYRTNNSD